MKIWIVLAALLCAGAGWWYGVHGMGKSAAVVKPNEKEAIAKVERGNIHIVLSRTGKIDAKESVKISHKVRSDTMTITSIVPEGSYVTKGQELVSFNNAKQKTDVETAEGDYKAAASDVDIAKQAVEITQRENTDALSQAQFKYRAAQLEYEKAEKGELPQSERKMKLEIEKAESEVKQAKESYELITDKDVIAQGFATPTDIEKERIRYRAAQIQAEVTTSELEVFRKYTRPVSLTAKQADVETTRAATQTIENVNANKLRQKNAEYEAKQEKQRQFKDRLQIAREQLEATNLKAPNDGLVIYGDSGDDEGRYSRGNGPIRVGAQVYYNQTVITLPKMDEMIIKTNIAEVDINRVKKGMRVVISADAYPDLNEIGTVDTIGNVASRSYFDATNNYTLTVQLRKGDLKIKPGVSAKIEIEIDELKNVLLVPVNAVFKHDGRNFAYVKSGGIECRELKLGSNNDTHVVVQDGLKEGDAVMLYEPEHVELPPTRKSPGVTTVPATTALTTVTRDRVDK